MEPFKTLSSLVIPLVRNDIDTDQIIPARYLKVTDKASLAEGLFAGWRYQASGEANPEFVLNQASFQGAQILLAGDKFGCGSSREHAVWALAGWGIRAILSTSFADIFRNNALKNGLLPVKVSPETHQTLREWVATSRPLTITVNLETQTLTLPYGATASFPIDPFSKTCLLQGVDTLGYLQQFEAEISAYEAAHPQPYR